uniref:Uncharacterized protein n=1 Tax=Cacopsylla melanoneura TaxID=428564 RepID=A0A8D8RCW8_9HEMI
MLMGNYIGVSLALYQLVEHSDQSKVRLFKFVSELVLSLFQLYSHCSAAEIWDDFHSRSRTSLYSSRWYACTRSTRRNMGLVLRRLRKPNHLEFYRGCIVINNPLFVGLLRVCYQVVNLMRLKSTRV